MLASDLNNTEFTNPINPDSVLHVEFYLYAAVDKWRSETEGKEVRGPQIPYVRIMRPGDNTSIHETPVRDDHKRRFPQQWLSWQIKEGLIDGGADVPGWKIDEWPTLNEEQRHELKYLRFHTVEQIAGASDAQVQRLGIGGVGLREQARVALKERNRAEYKAELEAKDKELAAMKADIAALKASLTPAPNTLHIPKKV